jgi:hypothetical protein
MYTLLTILHVWAAAPDTYGAFEIGLTPGLTAEQCIALNDRSDREARNEVCDTDVAVATFVSAHGCQVSMREWPGPTPMTTVKLLCVR